MHQHERLEPVYREAIYEVDLPSGTVGLRVGDPPPPGLPQPLAIVTAYNPGTERPGEAANRAANRRMAAEITRRGWESLPARGRNQSGTHVEPSFALVGVSRENAVGLAEIFGQAAIVYIGSGTVELLWCASPSDPSA